MKKWFKFKLDKPIKFSGKIDNKTSFDHTHSFFSLSGDNGEFLKLTANDKKVVGCNNCKNFIDFELWCNTSNCPYCLASTSI